MGYVVGSRGGIRKVKRGGISKSDAMAIKRFKGFMDSKPLRTTSRKKK
jgi:hypothetical protein